MWCNQRNPDISRKTKFLRTGQKMYENSFRRKLFHVKNSSKISPSLPWNVRFLENRKILSIHHAAWMNVLFKVYLHVLWNILHEGFVKPRAYVGKTFFSFSVPSSIFCRKNLGPNFLLYYVLKLTNLEIKFSKKLNFKMSFPENLDLGWFYLKTFSESEFLDDRVHIFSKISRKRYWNQWYQKRENKFSNLRLGFAHCITLYIYFFLAKFFALHFYRKIWSNSLEFLYVIEEG